MDKKDRANKRRQDKHHKKPPPSAAAAKDKPGKKEAAPAVQHQSSAPLIVYDDPYSRRPIEPNWSRDRDLPPVGPEDSSSDDDGQLLAADLEKLLQLPPSASGHFFLSTEKHWIEDSQQQQQAIFTGQHFRIDSKQLNLCLRTIPFHERNGYPAELFSKRELDSIALKATFEVKKYQDYRNKQPPTTTTKMSAEGSPRVPPTPTPCLIGPDALPPGEPPVEVIRPPTPPRPVPCLIGPMALPPELRHDPNVTGSYKSIPEQVQDDVVPLGEADGDDDEVMPEEVPSSSGGQSKVDKDKSNEAVKVPATTTTTTASETKEDIQAWLDDILDS